MSEPRSRSSLSFAEQLKSLVITPEVLRLIYDVTACTVEWDGEPTSIVPPQARGLELFPCFAMYFQRHLVEVKGAIFPNLVAREWEGLSHVIRLELPGMTLDVRLHTLQTTFLLSPFHIRFLSILFGRLVLHQLSLTPEGRGSLSPFTPYSLEEQVVAGYLQSLEWAPCATIKLDAQDNPYIGSMLHSSADLRRCEMPGSGREEAIIRAWRLFKSLLYYSVEGERLYHRLRLSLGHQAAGILPQALAVPALVPGRQLHLPGPGTPGPEAVPPQRRRPPDLPGHVSRPHRRPDATRPGNPPPTHHPQRLAVGAAPGHHLAPGPGQLLDCPERPEKPAHPPVGPGIPPRPPAYSPVPGRLLAGTGAPVERGLPRHSCRRRPAPPQGPFGNAAPQRPRGDFSHRPDR